jgi:hypothetical protein
MLDRSPEYEKMSLEEIGNALREKKLQKNSQKMP